VVRSLLLVLVGLVLRTPLSLTAAPGIRPSADAVREWQSRKFGMFIHFGLYSTLGGVWHGKAYDGNYSEQIQSDAHITEPEYAALARTFRPERWDPDAIVQLARDAGMQFIVLTSKHHDGFNLFGTHETKFNVVDGTPYGRDIVKSLADACARQHLPFGVYYSTIDWHYGDTPEHRNDNRISAVHEEFNARQLQELMTQYGPITEIWFDMGHPTKLQSEHFANTVHKYQPNCLVGGRVWNSQGDFLEMGDDEIPDYILDEPWESPASIFKETWGYRSWQKRTNLEEKRREHILRLVKVVSHGGNYILNIGPKGDGSVVPYEADVLRGIGTWLKANGAAIYGTQPQPFRKLDFGYATVKGNRMFLFVQNLPPDGNLILPGMRNPISQAYLLTDPGRHLSVTKTSAGDSAIRLAEQKDFMPVVAVDFAGPLDVRQGPILQVQSDGALILRQDQAERFFNTNGEGYYDAPTLRKEQWVFSVTHAGRFLLQLEIGPGKFSRVLDVTVNGRLFPTTVYGGDKLPTTVGEVQLDAAKDVVITVEPGRPAERGTVLDANVEKVVLRPVRDGR
jgi:alpha-L-fucosidase